jgi:WD40 repeat protein
VKNGSKISETPQKNRFDDDRSLVLSPTGKFGLVKEYEKSFRLIDAKTNETLKEFPYIDQLDNLVFTSDERYFLAKPWWSGWQLWNVEEGRPIREFDVGYSYYNHVAFQPGGSLFVTGGASQNILMFDLKTGQKVWSLFPIDNEEFKQEKIAEAKRVAFLKWQKEYAEGADIDNKGRVKQIVATFSHYGDAESFWDQRIAETGDRRKSELELPKAKANVAWFTLTNNSDMPISIDTNSMMFNPKCKGLCDGSEVSSRYVMELKSGETRVNGYDMFAKTIVPPKTSIYFSISLQHFAESAAIYLGFTFTKPNPDDHDSEAYGTEQKLYLRESDLPR